jgi:epoxyqueuosine reductase
MARNAAIVIGNLRDPDHLSLLEMGLADTSWEVREACAWALSRFEGDQKAQKLLERGFLDPDERVNQTAKRGLEGQFRAS